MNNETVFVMMSGGVDSSVAAADLKDQGYNVVGVFMKCWSIESLESVGASKDIYGCFWEEDSRDARLVADKLDIPFYVWDFQDEYKDGVVQYMLDEYRSGRTPNPDVMCNSVIKFGIFYRKARKLGADFVATGHYVRKDGQDMLYRGKDSNKDQTYFVWNIKKEVLPHTLFPVGEYDTKAEVRERAQDLDLITAGKKDSQGLCFIGQTPLRELLLQTLGRKTGVILDDQGKILGEHPGAYLYTIGQRHGLDLPGGPWFVTNIDVSSNEVYVSHKTQEKSLYQSRLTCASANWLVGSDVYELGVSQEIQAQIRYRQRAIECVVRSVDSQVLDVVFSDPVKAVASGQSVVFYDGDRLLGGAIIQ